MNSKHTSQAPAAMNRPFGTVFAAKMSVASFSDGSWEPAKLMDVEAIPLHPATHALHYGSACFEGLKAHRGVDGKVRIFRLDAHVNRFEKSADRLMLPFPGTELVAEMITDTVTANRDEVPEPPGALYIRPTLIGTEPNVGAAAAPSSEALLFILTSPVGDYFAGGIRPLRLAVETELPRTTPQFGMVKSGANYAMALGITQAAKRELGVDQVLFASDGEITETGASNFLLIDGDRVVTRSLDPSFLHGVTRDSVLTLARDLGYRVEERSVSVSEMLEWGRTGEAALSGTAAVLSGVGAVVHRGTEYVFGDGQVGENTLRLRSALTDIHVGLAGDPYGWTTII